VESERGSGHHTMSVCAAIWFAKTKCTGIYKIYSQPSLLQQFGGWGACGVCRLLVTHDVTGLCVFGPKYGKECCRCFQFTRGGRWSVYALPHMSHEWMHTIVCVTFHTRFLSRSSQRLPLKEPLFVCRSHDGIGRPE
jgi:hypothetical protein